MAEGRAPLRVHRCRGVTAAPPVEEPTSPPLKYGLACDVLWGLDWGRGTLFQFQPRPEGAGSPRVLSQVPECCRANEPWFACWEMRDAAGLPSSPGQQPAGLEAQLPPGRQWTAVPRASPAMLEEPHADS